MTDSQAEMTHFQAVYYRAGDGQEPVRDFIGDLDAKRRAVLLNQLGRLNELRSKSSSRENAARTPSCRTCSRARISLVRHPSRVAAFEMGNIDCHAAHPARDRPAQGPPPWHRVLPAA